MECSLLIFSLTKDVLVPVDHAVPILKCSLLIFSLTKEIMVQVDHISLTVKLFRGMVDGTLSTPPLSY